MKVIKALNTVNCDVMVDAARVAGTHTIFMSGNDADAKKTVHELLAAFGWRDIVDLGDIASARTSESYLSLWLALWKKLGTAHFKYQRDPVVRLRSQPRHYGSVRGDLFAGRPYLIIEALSNFR